MYILYSMHVLHNIQERVKGQFLLLYRDFVMRTITQLDPLGSLQCRCRRLCRRKYRSKVIYSQGQYCSRVCSFIIQGPNYVWHCDGYDKMKPYGFPIHGCIDGYVCMNHGAGIAIGDPIETGTPGEYCG